MAHIINMRIKLKIKMNMALSIRLKSIKMKKKKSDKYLKYEGKYKKSLTNYKTIKTSLKSIVKYPESIDTVNKAVININKIIIHTYQFFKLYYLHKYTNNENIPVINNKFINAIMKTVCIKNPSGSKPKQETIILQQQLSTFYDNHYKDLMSDDDDLYYTQLNTVLDYESITVVTGLKNHISEHFETFMNRYINVLTNKDLNISNIKNEKRFNEKFRKILVKYYIDELRELKNDIIKGMNNCASKYNNIKNKIRDTILPKLSNTNTINKVLADNPLLFLNSLIKMSIEIEKKGLKTFSCFPLRKNIIPKYIKLDTTTIVRLLFPDAINKSTYMKKGKTKLLQDDIWSFLFKTKNTVFKHKGYTFNHSITTDGVGCSLLFIRNDLYDPLKVVKLKGMTKPFNFRNERYIDELTDEETEKFKEYHMVGIDPGKDDLIYATNGDTKIINGKHETTTFRYTQNQRKKETKSRKYKKLIDTDKKITIPFSTEEFGRDDWLENFDNDERKFEKLRKFINSKNQEDYDKTVKELETELSKVNGKSCIYSNVKEYIKHKNRINAKLLSYYSENPYRKLKWYSFINRQRTDANMIEAFKEVFGSPKNTLVCIGDYDNHHMKYKDPAKGKSYRKLFRNAGYNIFLVNEYNTSKKSFLNGSDTEKFRRHCNPRPWKTNMSKSHGLLRFPSVPMNKSSRHILVNRDFNGSMNILLKAKCQLRGEPIPLHLRR